MRRHVIAALGLLLCSLSTTVHAGEADVAKKRYAEGAALFDKGDFGHAADAFGESYRLAGQTKTLWNLAIAEYKASHLFAAWKHLNEYAAKADANPKNVERGRTLLDELQTKIARFRIVAPAGAEVTIDGTVVGTTPLPAPVEVDPSVAHTVIVRISGRDEQRQDIEAPGANELNLKFVTPEAAAPAPVAPPPVAATSIAPVTTTTTKAAPLRIWVTVGLGVGAAALAGAGVYMGIQSNNSHDQAASQSAAFPNRSWCASGTNAGCSDLRSTLSSQDSQHTASMLLYGAAGVFAAGAIVSWFVLPREKNVVETAHAAPLVGPHLLGAAWSGSF